MHHAHPAPDDVMDVPALLERVTGAGPWETTGSIPGTGMVYRGIVLIDALQGYACRDGSGWTARSAVICGADGEADHISTTVVYADTEYGMEDTWRIGFDLDTPGVREAEFSDLFRGRWTGLGRPAWTAIALHAPPVEEISFPDGVGLPMAA